MTPGQWYRWRLDGAEVYLCNRGGLWQWATRSKKPEALRRDFGGPDLVDPPNEPLHDVVAPCQAMALRPFALRRPFVVASAHPVHIHRGEEAVFLIDLPVSVHWQGESGEVLAHPNTIDLSRTWFGDTTAGRLCFLWPFNLVSPGSAPYGSQFRCRIVVRNFARTPLVLKQFAIYCEMLSLWDLGHSLGSDVVVLEGLADGSLRMGTSPNEENRGAELLYEASVGQTELLIQKGVDFLRAIAGIA